MPRILTFRHVPFEGLGRIEPVLRAHAYDIDYADLYLPAAPLPDITRYHALIFMGGPMSVNDDLPYLRREEQYIRDAIARGIPLLGVCLGAQLIAHALGATVRRNPVSEIGWFEIEFTQFARRDPVFQVLTARTLVSLARRELRSPAWCLDVGLLRAMPEPFIPHRRRRLWPAISPRGDTPDDRGLVPPG